MWKDTFNMSWIQTATDVYFYPFDPDPEMIRIEDIAHALSHLCRFTGHTREFYSVAQHSVYVSFLCPQEHKLWGLLHDATEAYINDLSSPVKAKLNQYKIVEKQLMRTVCDAFNLPHEEPLSVKDADIVMLHKEMRELMPPRLIDDCQAHRAGFPIIPWSPHEAKTVFLSVFQRLTVGHTVNALGIKPLEGCN